MLGTTPTPFDLNLVAFRIPVRVHPGFWIGSAILGWHPDQPKLTFLWVICVFVSVLVHELGHAFTAEFFRWPSSIELYLGGGVTLSDRFRGRTPGRELAVSIMGPMAGFLLFGLVFAMEIVLTQARVPMNIYVRLIFFYLKYINLWWGIFNLLPVLPLDGGHIAESLCELLRIRNSRDVALKISIVVGAIMAYVFYEKYDQNYAALMMVLFCVNNFNELQHRRH